MDYKIDDLVDKIKMYLSTLLNESGSIVFSSIDTLRKGELYTLGLNPGGDAIIPLTRILNELPLKKNNAYIDEQWKNKKSKNYKKGQHPLQQNYNGILNKIVDNPLKVFGTNLIFTRSQGEAGTYYPERADICWKVHQEFIKIVDPKYFIVFGNSKISPFQYISNRYNLQISESIDSGHGNWKCYYSNGEIEGRERSLIGIPHLSRYWIIYQKEVLDWINSKMN